MNIDDRVGGGSILLAQSMKPLMFRVALLLLVLGICAIPFAGQLRRPLVAVIQIMKWEGKVRKHLQRVLIL